MKSIEKENKKRRNTLNIILGNYKMIFIILYLKIILSKDNNLRKLNLNYEISYKIKLEKSPIMQPILNKNINNRYIGFKYVPSKIYINNILRNITEDMKYNLTQENEIRLIFNESLTDCNAMFYNLSNIKEIYFLKSNFSNLKKMISTFEQCTTLVSLNLNNIDSSKVVDMSNMFRVVII